MLQRQKYQYTSSDEEFSLAQSRNSGAVGLLHGGQNPPQQHLHVSIFDDRIIDTLRVKPEERKSFKSCDLDDEEIDEFNELQQQQLQQQEKANEVINREQQSKSQNAVFIDSILPVRRLDFSNLPPGTPPQQSHRGQRVDFPSTGLGKDDHFEHSLSKGRIAEYLPLHRMSNEALPPVLTSNSVLQINRKSLAAFSQTYRRPSTQHSRSNKMPKSSRGSKDSQRSGNFSSIESYRSLKDKAKPQAKIGLTVTIQASALQKGGPSTTKNQYFSKQMIPNPGGSMKLAPKQAVQAKSKRQVVPPISISKIDKNEKAK